MQQIDIFDYMQTNIFEFVEAEEKHTDFRFMTDEEIAKAIGQAVGLHFEYNKRFNEWVATVKKIDFGVKTSNYACKDKEGQPVILVNVQKTYGDFEGRGGPMDSLDEAISFFQHNKKYFLEKEN